MCHFVISHFLNYCMYSILQTSCDNISSKLQVAVIMTSNSLTVTCNFDEELSHDVSKIEYIGLQKSIHKQSSRTGVADRFETRA